MNAYSEEELDRGDFLRDQRRDAKMEKALREMLDNQPADNEKEVMLYALTYLQSNMSEDVAEDMMDYVSPDAIIEDEIVSAIESIATSLMCPAQTRIQTNLCPKQPTTNNREGERTVKLVYRTEFDLTDSLKYILKEEGRDILTVPSEELEEMAIQQVEDYDFNKRAGLEMTVTVEDTNQQPTTNNHDR